MPEISALYPFLFLLHGFLPRTYADCPAGWFTSIMDKSHCLLYVPTPVHHDDAHAACQYLGGSLARPSDHLASASILYAIQVVVEKEYRSDIWLDIRLQGDVWRSATGGNLISPLPWQDGQSQHEGKAECAILLYRKGKLRTRQCNNRAAYMCIAGIDDGILPVTNCSGLPAVSENTQLSQHVGPLAQGTFLYMSCERGYRPAGDMTSKTMCLGTGGWSELDSLLQCTKVACQEPLIGTSVLELSPHAISQGSLRNFTCERGSGFPTDETYKVFICNGEGMWESLYESKVQAKLVVDCLPEVSSTGSRHRFIWVLIAGIILRAMWPSAEATSLHIFQLS